MGIYNDVVNMIAPPQAAAGASPYSVEALKLKKQLAMADALRQQAGEAVPVNSYNGIQAPISWGSVLAKALKGAGASMQEGRAEDTQKELSATEAAGKRDAVEQYIKAIRATDGGDMGTGGAGGADFNPMSGAIAAANAPPPVAPTAPVAGAPPVAPVNPTAPVLPGGPPPGAPPPGPMPVQGGPPGGPQNPMMPGARAPGGLAAGSGGSSDDFLRAMTADAGPGAAALQNALLPKYLEQQQAKQLLGQMDLSGIPPSDVAIAKQQAAMGDLKGAFTTLQKAKEIHYSGGAAWQGGKVVGRAADWTELTPEQAGIPPNEQRPGAHYLRNANGDFKIVNASDMASMGKQGQLIDLAQQRANVTTAAIKERGGVSDDDATNINRAIREGRLDPNRASTRAGMKTYAQLLKDDPEADFVTPAGLARMKQNPQIQMKIQTAAAIPQMLTNLRDVVGQLNYSDVKAVGGFQKWWKQQSNDPTLAKYGPVRSDLILRITNAMRGIGMSDKATELEERINSETMSPKAIAGYIEGQMESIMPQLQMYGGIALRTPGMAPTGLPVMAGTQFPTKPGAQPTNINAPAPATMADIMQTAKETNSTPQAVIAEARKRGIPLGPDVK